MTLVVGIVDRSTGTPEISRDLKIRGDDVLGLLDLEKRVIYLATDHPPADSEDTIRMVDGDGFATIPQSNGVLEPQPDESLPDIVDQIAQLSKIPAAAESLIFLLIRNDERDALIGDLTERHSELCKRQGKLKADLYAYAQVCRSLYPFFKRALCNSSRLFTSITQK